MKHSWTAIVLFILLLVLLSMIGRSTGEGFEDSLFTELYDDMTGSNPTENANLSTDILPSKTGEYTDGGDSNAISAPRPTFQQPNYQQVTNPGYMNSSQSPNWNVSNLMLIKEGQDLQKQLQDVKNSKLSPAEKQSKTQQIMNKINQLKQQMLQQKSQSSVPSVPSSPPSAPQSMTQPIQGTYSSTAWIDNDSHERRQDKHIDEIRMVLKDTISQLRKDDLLPPGNNCNCDSAPFVNRSTGNAEPANGCRPPGWLRYMEARNGRENTPSCPGAKATPMPTY